MHAALRHVRIFAVAGLFVALFVLGIGLITSPSVSHADGNSDCPAAAPPKAGFSTASEYAGPSKPATFTVPDPGDSSKTIKVTNLSKKSCTQSCASGGTIEGLCQEKSVCKVTETCEGRAPQLPTGTGGSNVGGATNPGTNQPAINVDLVPETEAPPAPNTANGTNPTYSQLFDTTPTVNQATNPTAPAYGGAAYQTLTQPNVGGSSNTIVPDQSILSQAYSQLVPLGGNQIPTSIDSNVPSSVTYGGPNSTDNAFAPNPDLFSPQSTFSNNSSPAGNLTLASCASVFSLCEVNNEWNALSTPGKIGVAIIAPIVGGTIAALAAPEAMGVAMFASAAAHLGILEAALLQFVTPTISPATLPPASPAEQPVTVEATPPQTPPEPAIPVEMISAQDFARLNPISPAETPQPQPQPEPQPQPAPAPAPAPAPELASGNGQPGQTSPTQENSAESGTPPPSPSPGEPLRAASGAGAPGSGTPSPTSPGAGGSEGPAGGSPGSGSPAPTGPAPTSPQVASLPAAQTGPAFVNPFSFIPPAPSASATTAPAPSVAGLAPGIAYLPQYLNQPTGASDTGNTSVSGSGIPNKPASTSAEPLTISKGTPPTPGGGGIKGGSTGQQPGVPATVLNPTSQNSQLALNAPQQQQGPPQQQGTAPQTNQTPPQSQTTQPAEGQPAQFSQAPNPTAPQANGQTGAQGGGTGVNGNGLGNNTGTGKGNSSGDGVGGPGNGAGAGSGGGSGNGTNGGNSGSGSGVAQGVGSGPVSTGAITTNPCNALCTVLSWIDKNLSFTGTANAADDRFPTPGPARQTSKLPPNTTPGQALGAAQNALNKFQQGANMFKTAYSRGLEKGESRDMTAYTAYMESTYPEADSIKGMQDAMASFQDAAGHLVNSSAVPQDQRNKLQGVLDTIKASQKSTMEFAASKASDAIAGMDKTAGSVQDALNGIKQALNSPPPLQNPPPRPPASIGPIAKPAPPGISTGGNPTTGGHPNEVPPPAPAPAPASQPPPVPPAATQPLRAGANGHIDPVAFAQRAAYKVANSPLNGKIPAQTNASVPMSSLGITTGSPSQWARLFDMIQQQESGNRVANVNPNGTLQKFSTTPWSEKSYGPGQFNIGEYGLNTWSDVNNPDRVIDAYINVALQGQLFTNFGSLKRPNETSQWSSWYDKSVAPNVGATPTGPTPGAPAPAQIPPQYKGGTTNPSIQPGNPGYAPGITRVAQCPSGQMCYTDAQTGASGVPSDPNMTPDQFQRAAAADAMGERLAQQGKLPTGAQVRYFTATPVTPLPARTIGGYGNSLVNGTPNAQVPPNPNGTVPTAQPRISGTNQLGANPVIIRAMTEASKYLPPGYSVKVISTSRGPGQSDVGSRSYHIKRDANGNSLAVDVTIVDANGNPLVNPSTGTAIRTPQYFQIYREFMQNVHAIQNQLDPNYSNSYCSSNCGRWGGYFITGDAQDLMHYDLGPANDTAAGNWQNGLSSQHASYGSPGQIGQGMGTNYQLLAQSPSGPSAPAAPQQTYTITDANGNVIANNIPLAAGTVGPDGVLPLITNSDGQPLGADGQPLRDGGQPLSNTPPPQGTQDTTNPQQTNFPDNRPQQPTPAPAPGPGTGPGTTQPNYCIMSTEPVVIWTMSCAQAAQVRQNAAQNPLQQIGQLLGQLIRRSRQQQQALPQQYPPLPQPLPFPNISPNTPNMPPVAIVTLVANPKSVASGHTSRISWSSLGTLGCQVGPLGGTILGTSTNGSALSSALSTTTVFTAQCQAQQGGTVASSTTVTVH